MLLDSSDAEPSTYSDRATSHAVQSANPSNEYGTSSTVMSDINDFTADNGDLGPFFVTELFDASLFGGYMPPLAE